MFRLEYSLYQNFRKPYQLPVSTNNIPYSKILFGSFHKIVKFTKSGLEMNTEKFDEARPDIVSTITAEWNF